MRTRRCLPSPAFKTDVDISFKALRRGERELQAWADDSTGLDLGPGGANSSPGATIGHGDAATFGAGGAAGWDQFATNEALFGVRAGFDEDAYTTKLDRSAPDYKERERKAQAIANEIMSVSAGAGRCRGPALMRRCRVQHRTRTSRRSAARPTTAA
jgi:PAB1-binding protein PBP1